MSAHAEGTYKIAQLAVDIADWKAFLSLEQPRPMPSNLQTTKS